MFYQWIGFNIVDGKIVAIASYVTSRSTPIRDERAEEEHTQTQ
jgi:hypothetical protein